MNKSVLILDDDEQFAKVVEIKLKGWDPSLQISHASSISSAREILELKNDFYIAIIDQHLPDGFGYQVLEHPNLANTTILAVSSDDSPELPASTVRAGAQHFLGKRHVTTPLFIPLVEALTERKKIEGKIREAELSSMKFSTVRTLLATLRHEINNPLGAVLGGAYLIKQEGTLAQSQKEALRLIEESGKRISQVIQRLCDAVELETTIKADETVFNIPGDKPWPKPDKL